MMLWWGEETGAFVGAKQRNSDPRVQVCSRSVCSVDSKAANSSWDLVVYRAYELLKILPTKSNAGAALVP